ncbi:MAG: aminotransferase class I/II-fold pyridoxal phosphate-dependent enzyme [Clostridia bacterium]|nr:aminotransferase class I/II-fold pyridoxal phosphate-dependent enzyme [Clostridia bacterium]
MSYNFDEIFNRAATNASKWTYAPAGTIAMTVADMDFRLAPEIAEGIKEAVDRGESGYVSLMESDYQAVIDWVKDINGTTINREHLIATPGVLYAARTAMYALTNPGDKVVVQRPLHTPSIATASMMGRIPMMNQFIYENGKYMVDFNDLEQCFKNGAKVFMLCAPNNPTGRVWTKEELQNIAYLANKYNVYVVSDEIHRDIVWGNNRHISPTEIPELADRSVAVFSTSKSFNMGAYHIGSAVIPNEDIRKKVVSRFYEHGHPCDRPSLLCIAAQTAAYTRGKAWFQAMKSYVGENIRLAREYLADLPIRPNDPEGTFLLWIDIADLGFDAEKLRHVMEHDWKVMCDPGSYYDTKDYMDYTGLEHHVRMNLATPRPLVEEACDRIRKYFK